MFQAGLKAGLCPAPASSGPVCPESRYCSRIACPLARCRPSTLPAIGQNRQKLGNTAVPNYPFFGLMGCPFSPGLA
jgi:hypothetical protein